MNIKWTNILSFVLLIAALASSSACSLTSINAQSQRPTTPNSNSTPESSEVAYKPPKRVSKDIIKPEEKPAKTKTK